MTFKNLLKKEYHNPNEFWQLYEIPLVFAQHIQNHLREDEVILCKICNKTIDEIYKEEKPFDVMVGTK